MNTKRQTVWLVSMLSLMVVLSAYYLFTEDAGSMDLTTKTLAGSEIKVDTVTNETGGTVKNGTVAAGPDTAKKTDEDVIRQVQASANATSGKDYFTSAQLKRTEEFAKHYSDWAAISVDPKKTTAEVEAAIAEVQKLQDQDEKVINIEETLQKDYSNAVLLQEGGKWKVVVQAAKLEKSEGVSIIDLVMKELNVTPDKVTVQYMQ